MAFRMEIFFTCFNKNSMELNCTCIIVVITRQEFIAEIV
jgi:hypothetical protein